MDEETSGGAAPREGVLRRRLLLAFLALSLVPLFGSNALGYLRSRGILEEQARRNLDAVADLQATNIQDRLDQRLLYLRAIASGNRFLLAAAERLLTGTHSVMADVATPAEVSAYLRRKVAESGRFAAFALFDTGGRLIAASDPDHLVNDWQPEAAARVALLRTADPETPPTLRLTVPVEGPGGATLAHLAATVPLERGVELFEVPEHVAGSIESFITDERGRPIFVSHPHGHLEYDEPLASPLIHLPPGSGARYLDREGVEVLGASAELPAFGWLFVTEVPVTDVLGDLRSLRSLSLALGGIFAPLVLIAAWLMAGGIVAPVRRLVGATRELGSGNLDVRVSAHGQDEVAELGTAFNEMAAELSSNQQRIERLHRQEIERAEQLATVGELASGLAHEIKNPVVGISNGLDLILRRLEGDTTLEPIATEMSRQLKRIEMAVQDLLSYARPPELRIAATSPNEVVRRAVTLVEPGASKKGVRIERVLDPELPEIPADAELLGQALVNLLLNAVAFSPKGGAVEVTTRRGPENVTISVQDRGAGIEEDLMDQLFKPFFTTRHSGTGLGLPITRGIVERHGGRVTVESRPGEGALFTLVIPIEEPTGAPDTVERSE